MTPQNSVGDQSGFRSSVGRPVEIDVLLIGVDDVELGGRLERSTTSSSASGGARRRDRASRRTRPRRASAAFVAAEIPTVALVRVTRCADPGLRRAASSPKPRVVEPSSTTTSSQSSICLRKHRGDREREKVSGVLNVGSRMETSGRYPRRSALRTLLIRAAQSSASWTIDSSWSSGGRADSPANGSSATLGGSIDVPAPSFRRLSAARRVRSRPTRRPLAPALRAPRLAARSGAVSRQDAEA